MNHGDYQSLTIVEKQIFLGKVIIAAQSQEHFQNVFNIVQNLETKGFYDKVGPGELLHSETAYIDSPLENGTSSPQN
jgi:hypothetical protein